MGSAWKILQQYWLKNIFENLSNINLNFGNYINYFPKSFICVYVYILRNSRMQYFLVFIDLYLATKVKAWLRNSLMTQQNNKTRIFQYAHRSWHNQNSGWNQHHHTVVQATSWSYLPLLGLLGPLCLSRVNIFAHQYLSINLKPLKGSEIFLIWATS